jgi:hypothetical protein
MFPVIVLTKSTIDRNHPPHRVLVQSTRQDCGIEWPEQIQIDLWVPKSSQNNTSH